MLHTTRAVILRVFRHTDRSLVLKAYTEAFGARSYMMWIGKKQAARSAVAQPLARVELVVSERDGREMHQVREARVERPYHGVASDPIRGMLLLFAQEVFYRTLRTESADQALFNFVQETLGAVDTGPNTGLQPVMLLVGLAEHMGIRPQPPEPGEDLFDLQEGTFFRGAPPHAFCMDRDSSHHFAGLLHAGQGPAPLNIPGASRRNLLDQLLQYYRLHVDGFGALRSPAILHGMLH